MRTFILGLLLSILPLGCNPADDNAAASGDKPASPSVADVAKSYKTLQSMTKEPVYVDPMLAMLCRGASQKDVEEARKKSGPHAHTQVSIYMNDTAASAFRQSSAAYPVGSIIVKEKKGLDYWVNDAERKRKQLPDGVGGMIKRPPGFDADHGDWEYFYFEDPAKIESGKIASCVQCHAGAAKKDYVFGNWAKG